MHSRSALGETDARVVFADLREANDPETPVSVAASFPQQLPASTAPGSVVIDDGSFTGPAPEQAASASNALLVGAKRSATGHPLFVAGPQVGYSYPALLEEMELSGAGFSVRGAMFPGVPFVLVGRGPDFAWSASSSQADNVDLFVETLCDDDYHYLYRGQCEAMRRSSLGTLKAQGSPDEPLSYYETAHGPVVGYATTNGTRVAISSQRSTRGRELLNARAFYSLNTGRVTSAQSFLKTMSSVEFSFNWFYADDRDIAMFSSGRLPIRALGTDPALPTVGTGDYDWRGFVPFAGHPQAINPPSGVILNWNNKPAANVGAGDSNFSYGPIQRVSLLRRRSAARKKHTLATVTGAMNQAATQDLRVARCGRRSGDPPDRAGTERASGSSRRPRRRVASSGVEPPRPGPRRQDRQSRRSGDGRRMAATRRRRSRADPRPTRRAACGTARAQRRSRPPGIGVSLRLVRVRRQGPAHAPGQPGPRGVLA